MPPPGGHPRGACKEAKASPLCGHVSLSPLDPIFLLSRCIHCHTTSRHPFLVLHLVLPKQCFAAHSMASSGGFTFTKIITPQGTCQLLCSMVIKTSTLKIQGVFPSVSALLCVGRSLIHGSVLQPSHDRWVGWSEIQDLVTHEIAPVAQGSFTLFPITQNDGMAAVPCAVSHLPRRCGSPSSTFWARYPTASCPYDTACTGLGAAEEPIHLTLTAQNGKALLVIHPH